MRYGAKNILLFFEEMDKSLSRTVLSASVSTQVSGEKRPGRLIGDTLVSQISANRALIADFIDWKGDLQPKQPWECISSLLTIAEIAGRGVFPEGIFREWEYTGYDELRFDHTVAPGALGPALLKLGDELFLVRDIAGEMEKQAAIAGVEWEIAVGPL